jgi:hypothetical protein
VYLRVDWNFTSNHEHSFQKTHLKIIPLTEFCYIDMHIIFFSLKESVAPLTCMDKGGRGERHT